MSVAHAGTAPASSVREDRVSRIEAAFAQNYDFVWRLLRRFGVPAADVDDAAQQVFMTFARKIESIEPSKERTFLYGTAIKTAANARRSFKRRSVPLEQTHSSISPALPDDLTEAARLRDLLDEMLALMPDPLRRVLVLAEVEQYQVDEIASLEAIPVGTAASRLRRARQKFQELLAERRDRNPFARGEP